MTSEQKRGFNLRMIFDSADLMSSPISVWTGRRSRRRRFDHEFRRFDGPGDSGGTAWSRLGSAYIPLLPVDFFVCASVFFRNFGKFRAGDFFGPAVDLGQSRDFGAWRALRGRGGAFAGWSEGWVSPSSSTVKCRRAVGQGRMTGAHGSRSNWPRALISSGGVNHSSLPSG